MIAAPPFKCDAIDDAIEMLPQRTVPRERVPSLLLSSASVENTSTLKVRESDRDRLDTILSYTCTYTSCEQKQHELREKVEHMAKFHPSVLGG